MSKEERSRTASLRVKGARPSEASQIQVEGPILATSPTIVLTQAYCPNGHNLIAPDHAQFDGQPGIRLILTHPGGKGEITLSPVHGDPRKMTTLDPPPAAGTRMSITCPVCGAELPAAGDCPSGDGGLLRTLYITRRLDQGHAALVCDVWGCPYSQVVDEWSLLSEVVLQETADEE